MNENKTMFNTFSDIIVEFDRPHEDQKSNVVIIDTKYKLLNDDGRNHYNIKNDDIYQILAYKTLHIRNGEVPSVALVYPQNAKPIHKEFGINSEEKDSFFALTLNLRHDFQKGVGPLLSEIKLIFDHILK